jgi:hypothetical protein
MMGQQPPPFAGGMGMGTRGVGEQQVGGFQGQVEQQFPTPQQPGVAGPAMLSPQDRVALRGVLDILKEGRAALASGEVSEEVAQRLTAAHSYLAGYLEAKGLAQLGTFIQSLPPLTTRGVTGDVRYDQMVDGLEALVSDGDTRGWGSLVSGAIRAVPWSKVGSTVGQVVISAGGGALWDAAKRGYAWATR